MAKACAIWRTEISWPRLQPTFRRKDTTEMRVIFAPDWRGGVPYQELLAEALWRAGVVVDFLQGYKRVMPLSRQLSLESCDILHLHWPEAYFPWAGDVFDWFRQARFGLDLSGATRKCRLVTTAHNLHARNRSGEWFARRNARTAYRQSDVVFAHSELAAQQLINEFGLSPKSLSVIPHGDLSVTLGEPIPAFEARDKLSLGGGPFALVFGAVEPYKGLEEIIDWWRREKPAVTLAIVGKPNTEAYGKRILGLAESCESIKCELRWLPVERLRMWLSAADAVIFNYRQIFTSGAATLARSFGLPILLPARLKTVVLDEPSPFVHRFDSFETGFAAALSSALAISPDFASASHWRQSHSWDIVASTTVKAYESVLAGSLRSGKLRKPRFAAMPHLPSKPDFGR